MNHLKKIFLLFVFIFFIILEMNAKGFKEYIFAPKIGGAWVFAIPIYYNDSGESEGALTMNLDILFNHSSGFSFLIANNLFFLFNNETNAGINALPFYALNFLFGYTYGIGNGIEASIKAGIGIITIVWLMNIPVHFSLAKYFTNKYGIYFSILNNFAFYPENIKEKDQTILFNILNISIGPSFRL